eukprot:847840_1
MAELKLVKTLWGVDEPITPSLFKSIAADGYSGVEVIRLAYSTKEARATLVGSANAAGLALVCQIHTSGGYLSDRGEYVYIDSYDVRRHKDDLAAQVAECEGILREVKKGGFINVHAGVDAWTADEAAGFLEHASKVIAGCPFRVVVETHRQRLFCSPFSARDLLAHPKVSALANLKLNADLSHWFVACERVFDSAEKRDDAWWPALLEALGSRCEYVHCRFGSAQGPQIADPSRDEHRLDVELQLRNWVALWKAQAGRAGIEYGLECECWCCPEYGPRPYMPTLPTGEDVASLAGAVSWTKDLIKKTFEV